MSMTVLPLSSNGTQRGRTVVPLHTFTFPSSGIAVQCHKMSPSLQGALLQSIIKECKALPDDDPHAYPTPPMQPINYGTEEHPDIKMEERRGGEEVEAYQQRLRAWEVWAANKSAERLLIMVALDYLVVNQDDVTAELERTSRALARQGAEMPDLGIPLDGYAPEEIDRLKFLFLCCMLDPQNDGQAFLGFLIGRSQPREEAVQDRIASFRAPE